MTEKEEYVKYNVVDILDKINHPLQVKVCLFVTNIFNRDNEYNTMHEIDDNFYHNEITELISDKIILINTNVSEKFIKYTAALLADISVTIFANTLLDKSTIMGANISDYDMDTYSRYRNLEKDDFIKSVKTNMLKRASQCVVRENNIVNADIAAEIIYDLFTMIENDKDNLVKSLMNSDEQGVRIK